jgi:16S rRNA processing protein RimM
VRGLRGLRGHVRIELLTDRPEERFTVGTTLYPEGATRGLTIAESSAVADGPGWWLRFAEIPDRNAADALRGVYLEIEPPDEPREPGRWFWHELEGLAVRGSDGTELGRVVELYRAGGAEVFVVRGPRGEIDIPGVTGIVVELAPERGEMIVDMEALDMDARPVDDEDYVRPRDRRPANPKRPKAPKPPKAAPAEGTAAPAPSKQHKAAKGRGPKGDAAAKLAKGDTGTRVLTPEEIEVLRRGPSGSGG